MAPIAKFYSPLSVVLERSFEGLSKAKSHNKFNQVNANLARKNKWALPKGTGFFPLPYQLSQGTLPTVVVAQDGNNFNFLVGVSHTGAAATTIGELSADFIKAGYNAGDVVTIIAVVRNDDANTFFPVSMQFEVDSASTALLTSLEKNGISIVGAEGESWRITEEDNLVSAATVIVSRFDGTMWRRSSQFLIVMRDVISHVTDNAAVAAAIASYGMTAGDGNPLVYLDGDELADGQ
jgi:hypothetical protein